MEIIACRGDKHLEAKFGSFAVELSLLDKRRQPRFLDSESHLISGTNIFLKRGISQFWLAINDGKVVGRIAAMIDQDIIISNDTYGVGFLGLYEAIDHKGVARLLINTATTYLKQQGCERVWGPVDFSIYLGYRLQTSGFDTSAYLGEPRNPSYYVTHFITNGFKEQYRWESHTIDLPNVDRLIAAYKKDYEISVELSYRYKKFKAFSENDLMNILWSLIHKTYKNMPGFVSLEFSDFKQQFSGLTLMADLHTSMFLMDASEQIIGFNIIFKDYVKALRSMNAKTHFWAKCKFTLFRSDGPNANACHTGIEYSAIKTAVINGIKLHKYPLSLAKSLFYCSAVEVRKNPNYKQVIIALLRSDTPNIHLSRNFAHETRHYSLYSLRL